MPDTKIVSSGVTHAVEFMVTCDQTTIVGNGTTEDPLRSGVEAGFQVANDGVILPGGPFSTLDFQGLISATDAGGGAAAVTIPRGINLLEEGVSVADNPHNVLDFTGGVQVTNVGGGRATVDVVQSSVVFTWGVGQISLTTGFMQPGGSAVALSATDAVAIPSPVEGTLDMVRVLHNLAGTAGQSITYTVFVNGVATSVVMSNIPTGGVVQAFNAVQSVAVFMGDTLSVQVSVSGPAGSNTINAVFVARISLSP